MAILNVQGLGQTLQNIGNTVSSTTNKAANSYMGFANMGSAAANAVSAAAQENQFAFNAAEDDENATEAVRIRARRDNRRFAEKVIKYLWDDAFKFNKDEIFEISKVNSLEKVISVFVAATGNARFEGIFKTNIYDALVPKQ